MEHHAMCKCPQCRKIKCRALSTITLNPEKPPSWMPSYGSNSTVPSTISKDSKPKNTQSTCSSYKTATSTFMSKSDDHSSCQDTNRVSPIGKDSTLSSAISNVSRQRSCNKCPSKGTSSTKSEDINNFSTPKKVTVQKSQIPVACNKMKSSGTSPDSSRNIKMLDIDIEKAFQIVEDRKQSRGCHCEKKVPSRGIMKSEEICKKDQSFPVNVTFKKPDGQPEKPICECTKKECKNKSLDSLKSTTSSRQIILPEVTVDIGPEQIQTIQIDVKPTDLTLKNSGIITIPVQLRYRKSCKLLKEKEQPAGKSPLTENFVFDTCKTKKYYHEHYLEQLLEEQGVESLEEVEPPEEFEYKEEPKKIVIIDEPIGEHIECCEEKKVKPEVQESVQEEAKTETLELKEVPWYESIEKDNYVEPYLLEEYCTATDNVEVQTDLVLGRNLLSDSLNSVPDSKNEVANNKSAVNNCGCTGIKLSELIKWENVFLPAKETLQITPVEKLVDVISKKLFSEPAELPPILMIPWTPPPEPPKKNKKKFKSGCCKGIEEPPWPDPPEPEPLPPLVPIPSKFDLVYGINCQNVNEAYLDSLRREFPQEETEKNTMPWAKICLPENIKIRKIQELKMEKNTNRSYSAPCCVCGLRDDIKSNNMLHSCTSVPVKNTATCVRFMDSDKSDNELISPRKNTRNTCASFRNRKPSVQAIGCNKYKTKIFLNNPNKKNKYIANIRFAALGSRGKMSSKVTLKKSKNNNSGSSLECNMSSIDISPINSKIITCKYLNNRMVESTENSKPDITGLSPKPNICSAFIKPEKQRQFKPDPVVAAFQACEAELKPVREALNQLKRQLKNLNMPELDCIFKKKEELEELPMARSCKCYILQTPSYSEESLSSHNIKKLPFTNNTYKSVYTNSKFDNFFKPQATSSPICSRTKITTPARRNKGIQKSGGKHKNKRKKCTASYSKSSISSNSSESSSHKEEYIKPFCRATHPKINKCECDQKSKQIKSQISFSRVDSQCPFIEAIKSILLVDSTESLAKQMKNMKIHVRVRPSKSTKKR